MGAVTGGSRRKHGPPATGRALLLGAAGVLALGAAALAAVMLVRSESVGSVAESGDAALVLERQRTVPLAPRVRSVARDWILSAVNRSDLPAAYDLTHADIRGSLTRSEWASGNIPVVPYPVETIAAGSWRVDVSRESEALLEVELTSPEADVSPVTFLIGLRKVRGTWLVDYWSPAGRMGMP